MCLNYTWTRFFQKRPQKVITYLQPKCITLLKDRYCGAPRSKTFLHGRPVHKTYNQIKLVPSAVTASWSFALQMEALTHRYVINTYILLVTYARPDDGRVENGITIIDHPTKPIVRLMSTLPLKQQSIKWASTFTCRSSAVVKGTVISVNPKVSEISVGSWTLTYQETLTKDVTYSSYKNGREMNSTSSLHCKIVKRNSYRLLGSVFLSPISDNENYCGWSTHVLIRISIEIGAHFGAWFQFEAEAFIRTKIKIPPNIHSWSQNSFLFLKRNHKVIIKYNKKQIRNRLQDCQNLSKKLSTFVRSTFLMKQMQKIF